tara:strand:+ start:168 stop:695 length:528 start_codon:yes stop_codon:yes gene_type:complete
MFLQNESDIMNVLPKHGLAEDYPNCYSKSWIDEKIGDYGWFSEYIYVSIDDEHKKRYMKYRKGDADENILFVFISDTILKSKKTYGLFGANIHLIDNDLIISEINSLGEVKNALIIGDNSDSAYNTLMAHTGLLNQFQHNERFYIGLVNKMSQLKKILLDFDIYTHWKDDIFEGF